MKNSVAVQAKYFSKGYSFFPGHTMQWNQLPQVDQSVYSPRRCASFRGNDKYIHQKGLVFLSLLLLLTYIQIRIWDLRLRGSRKYLAKCDLFGGEDVLRLDR